VSNDKPKHPPKKPKPAKDLPVLLAEVELLDPLFDEVIDYVVSTSDIDD